MAPLCFTRPLLRFRLGIKRNRKVQWGSYLNEWYSPLALTNRPANARNTHRRGARDSAFPHESDLIPDASVLYPHPLSSAEAQPPREEACSSRGAAPPWTVDPGLPTPPQGRAPPAGDPSHCDLNPSALRAGSQGRDSPGPGVAPHLPSLRLDPAVIFSSL